MSYIGKGNCESRIAIIAKVEKTFKPEMSGLSRELIEYVYNSNDIGMVNRLLDVLTTANRKGAALYYREFLGWEFDKETQRFTSKLNDKKFGAAKTKAINWLKHPRNNIWVWLEENMKVEKKPTNYAANLQKLIQRGLKDESDLGLTPEKIAAVIVASDLKVDDFLKAMANLRK